MKEIKLTQGKVVFVDDEDYEFLNQFKWHYKNGYAAKSGKDGKRIWMHRLIIAPPDGLEIDHINRDGLDNRRTNLRIVSRKQNADNRGIFKNNSSGVKGVSFHNGKWQALYRHNGHLTYIGRFATIEKAQEAYEKTKSRLTEE